MLTSNVQPTQDVSGSGYRMSDEIAIRNVVSSVDLANIEANLPWQNAETGSRGAISSLVEDRSTGRPCRRFTTSRESFDGVALYRGEVCMIAAGAWRMESFASL